MYCLGHSLDFGSEKALLSSTVKPFLIGAVIHLAHMFFKRINRLKTARYTFQDLMKGNTNTTNVYRASPDYSLYQLECAMSFLLGVIKQIIWNSAQSC